MPMSYIHNVDATSDFWTGGRKPKSYKTCVPFAWSNNVIIRNENWLPFDLIGVDSDSDPDKPVDSCIQLVYENGEYKWDVEECYKKKFFICESKDWL